MKKLTDPAILQNVDALVSILIAKKKRVSEMEGLRMFLSSKTYEMLIEDDLKMWHYSPLALFNMWETEIATGDPRNSPYLRDDNYV